MLVLIYIIVTTYLLFFKKKDNFSWLIAAILMALLSITTKFYADLDNYGPLFDLYNNSSYQITSDTTNFLWAFLCKLFYSLGFNYRGMIIGLLFLNYYLLHRAVLNMGGNENKFFGLFLIFPSIIQLVQLKFFTASSIVIYAYSILIKNSKKSLFLYIILVLIASLIHSSAIVFLLLILCKKPKLNKKIVLFFSIILSVFLIINLNLITTISGYFISSQQYQRYFVDTITPSSIGWIIVIISVWCIAYFFGSYVRNVTNTNQDFNIERYLNKNSIAITLLVLTLPLLLIDRNMHRFLEVGYVILYFMIGLYLKSYKLTKNKLSFLMIFICSLVAVMLIYTPYNSVLKPLFTYDNFVGIRR